MAGGHDNALCGGAEGDLLIGGAGRDSLSGDAGNDTLFGGEGADTMAGGVGDDLNYFIEAQNHIIEFSGGGQDTIITSTDITMDNNVEVLMIADGVSGLSLVRGANGSVMIGNGLNHQFQGGAGDDVILAGGAIRPDITGLWNHWL